MINAKYGLQLAILFIQQLLFLFPFGIMRIPGFSSYFDVANLSYSKNYLFYRLNRRLNSRTPKFR